MHRFYKNETLTEEKSFVIDGQPAHQISRVLRMQVGDKITVFDNTSNDYICEITGFLDKSVSLSVLEPIENMSERPLKVHLYQAVPNKWPKFEEVLKKGTEMGVASFHPIKMKRCETKLKDGEELPKEERLGNIVVEACEQCGGLKLPGISNVSGFEEAVAEAPGIKIMAYEGDCERMLPDLLQSIHNQNDVSVFIGPEGGITDEEAEFFHKQGGYLFHLGKRILRTETAPIAILGAIFFGL